jgi:hypothetical protein
VREGRGPFEGGVASVAVHVVGHEGQVGARGAPDYARHAHPHRTRTVETGQTSRTLSQAAPEVQLAALAIHNRHGARHHRSRRTTTWQQSILAQAHLYKSYKRGPLTLLNTFIYAGRPIPPTFYSPQGQPSDLPHLLPTAFLCLFRSPSADSEEGLYLESNLIVGRRVNIGHSQAETSLQQTVFAEDQNIIADRLHSFQTNRNQQVR